RVALKRSGEERFARQEEDRELRRMRELRGVVLRGKLLDVGAYLTGMAIQMLLAQLIVVRLQGIEIRIHWRLGIDDEGLATGEVHHEVGPQALAFIVRRRVLDFEIAMLLHAGHLDDPPQLDLPPLAATGGLAQR